MFTNKRIKLRKLTIEDHLIYNEWRNDPEVMQSTSPYLDLYSLSETHSFIEMILNQDNAKGYIIETLDNHKAIGIISIINIDYKNRNAELIIDIGDKTMWNKGIGTEAIELILNIVFNEMNLHRLFLQVFAFNDSAIALYSKLGFTKEGQLREALYRNGKYHDIINMSILKVEYQEQNNKTQ